MASPDADTADQTDPCEPADESDADRLARVEAELAEIRARDGEVRRRFSERARTRSGTAASTVFSIRMDRAELRDLEWRAFGLGIRPSVLARNLIRIGLATQASDDVQDAVHRVEAAVRALRTLVG